MSNKFPILLIGGAGRSGTNVLKYVFETHSDTLALPFETRFTIDPDGVIPTYVLLRNGWTPFVAELATKRLATLLERVSKKSFLDKMSILFQKMIKLDGNIRAYKEWDLVNTFNEFDKLSDELISSLKTLEYEGTWAGAQGTLTYNKHNILVKRGEELEKIFSNYLYSIYGNILKEKRKKYYVEDNTFNILYAKDSLDILPSAFLVHMIRDPRDVVASYLKQRWTPKTLSGAVKYYKTIMEEWSVVKNKLSEDRYLEVQLEDLCMDTENVLKKICLKSGITYEDKMLDYPLNKSNTGRWKKEFNSSEQQYINEELKDILKEYKYI